LREESRELPPGRGRKQNKKAGKESFLIKKKNSGKSQNTKKKKRGDWFTHWRIKSGGWGLDTWFAYQIKGKSRKRVGGGA